MSTSEKSTAIHTRADLAMQFDQLELSTLAAKAHRRPLNFETALRKSIESGLNYRFDRTRLVNLLASVGNNKFYKLEWVVVDREKYPPSMFPALVLWPGQGKYLDLQISPINTATLGLLDHVTHQRTRVERSQAFRKLLETHPLYTEGGNDAMKHAELRADIIPPMPAERRAGNVFSTDAAASNAPSEQAFSVATTLAARAHLNAKLAAMSEAEYEARIASNPHLSATPQRGRASLLGLENTPRTSIATPLSERQQLLMTPRYAATPMATPGSASRLVSPPPPGSPTLAGRAFASPLGRTPSSFATPGSASRSLSSASALGRTPSERLLATQEKRAAMFARLGASPTPGSSLALKLGLGLGETESEEDKIKREEFEKWRDVEVGKLDAEVSVWRVREQWVRLVGDMLKGIGVPTSMSLTGLMKAVKVDNVVDFFRGLKALLEEPRLAQWLSVRKSELNGAIAPFKLENLLALVEGDVEKAITTRSPMPFKAFSNACRDLNVIFASSMIVHPDLPETQPQGFSSLSSRSSQVIATCNQMARECTILLQNATTALEAFKADPYTPYKAIHMQTANGDATATTAAANDHAGDEDDDKHTVMQFATASPPRPPPRPSAPTSSSAAPQPHVVDKATLVLPDDEEDDTHTVLSLGPETAGDGTANSAANLRDRSPPTSPSGGFKRQRLLLPENDDLAGNLFDE